jgi:23S rRNA pseudouridine1911/1915/1917 synthase
MTKRYLFEVDEAATNSRLDEFLAERLGALSRMRIATLLVQGSVRVNGQAAPGGLRLRGGDCVEVDAGEPAPSSMTPEPLPLEVVYEDLHLIIVVKPAGMLMHPTRGIKTGTLLNALAHHLGGEAQRSAAGLSEPSAAASRKARATGKTENSRPDEACDKGGRFEKAPADAAHPPPAVLRPGLVHRLDRATSGLVVVAKTQAALARLSDHFRRRLVEKHYLAVLRGEVAADELEIQAPIGRVAESQPHWRVTEAGRRAHTLLRVIERRRLLTLVDLEPVTGRTNQLRIHCAHIGHPVAGDEWYAADGLPRLCLHAARLAINHPATNERMFFASPLPSEIEAVWSAGG